MYITLPQKERIINLWHRCLQGKHTRSWSYKYMQLLPCIWMGYRRADIVEAANILELRDENYTIDGFNLWIRAQNVYEEGKCMMPNYRWPIECKDLRTKEKVHLHSEKEALDYIKPKVHPEMTDKEILNGIISVIEDDEIRSWAGFVFKQEHGEDIEVCDYLEEVGELFDKYFRTNKKYFGG